MRKLFIILLFSIFIISTLAFAQAAKTSKAGKTARKDRTPAAAKKTAPAASSAAQKPGPAASQSETGTDKNRVRPESFNARYSVNDDDTVLDKNTGLVWPRNANVSNLPLPYEQAKQHLQDMNSGKKPNFGSTDWRLPTMNEMESLIDKSRYYPALIAGHPFDNVQNYFYWTSSIGNDVVDYVWILDMASGEMTMDYVSSCSYKFFWPVRSSWMPTSGRASMVMTAGANDFGQLGDGTTGEREAFLPVTGLENVIKISAGLEHAIALKSDGSAWTWGRNDYGQLGTGTSEDSRVPVAVTALAKVVDVSAGMMHTLALTADGKVWTWGRNSYGQLGNGSNEDSTGPVRVSGLTGIVKVAAGQYHSIAVKSDGTVWTWGRNVYGQLGDGTTKDTNSPVKVAGISGVVSVTAGLHHTVALKSDKTVWAWGWNINGMLGDGTRKDQFKPVAVQSMSMNEFKPGISQLGDVVDIQAGLHHTVALRSDGTVWAWGGNEYSQVGAKAGAASAAVRVSGLGNIIKISAGMYHSMGLMTDGTIWVWGKDQKNLPPKTSPVRLWNIAGINDAAGGKFYTIVLSGGKSAEK